MEQYGNQKNKKPAKLRKMQNMHALYFHSW